MAIPLVALASDFALGFLGSYAYDAVNNYINKSPTAPSTPNIPVSKPSKSSLKVSRKQNLSSYVSGVSGILSDVVSSVSSSVSSGVTALESSSAVQSAKTSELLTPSQASPLLTNQVYIKDSLDKLIDAINTNALVTASVFGTLDANLSAIGSSLASISGTLIEISENYEDELLNIEDMPYTSQSELRKQLTELGLSSSEIDRLFQKENDLIMESSASGKSVSETKKLLLDLRKAELSAETQLAIAKIQAGISEPAPSSSTVSLSAPNLELWAGSAFAMNEAVTVDMHKRNIHAQVFKNEYITTETDIKDLDGNTIASVKPIEAQSIKNITDARHRTDINNFEMSDNDIDDMFDGDLPDFSSLFAYDPLSVRLQNVTSSL